jgi:Trypsin
LANPIEPSYVGEYVTVTGWGTTIVVDGINTGFLYLLPKHLYNVQYQLYQGNNELVTSRSQVLHKVTVPVISNSLCQSYNSVPITESMMCTSGGEIHIDIHLGICDVSHFLIRHFTEMNAE